MKWYFFLAFYMLPMAVFSQSETLNWKFFHPIQKNWIDAGTHGSVQEVLIANNQLPDPFYGKNGEQFDWIEKYDWEFTTQFIVNERQYKSNWIELDFPGIDTYARVYVNGKFVFQAENAFRPYSNQIREFVRLGANELKVVFTSPVNYHAKAYRERKTKLPAPNDPGEIAVSSMSRKPQYQFGWDWALRMNTIGFLKPVQVRFYNINQLLSATVDTKSVVENTANVQLLIQSRVTTHETYTVQSSWFGKLEHVRFHEGKFKINKQISNPKLWWPRGHGEAHLYQDTLILLNEKQEIIDRLPIHFGIRTTELIQEKDAWGTSFYFKINGKSIFAKGANYIPQDVFPARVTDAQLENMVHQMEVSNFNMVRIWGGGYYPDEAFYNACDRAGIMVWQDLMFACAMYPGDPAFLKNVEGELNYQIPRLTAHPSVVYFNGNNEVDIAWKHWGFQLRYAIGPKMQKSMEKDYDNLFKKLAPEVIASYTSIPYVHTSPLSHWGKDEYYNHGTQHYWGVWHGKDPIEDFGLKSGRFNAEYGFQSFPEYKTLLAFSQRNDWELESEVMKYHQKSYVGNGMIKKQSDRLYGETSDFDDFVYFSQLTQSKSVGIAVASHRIGSPRCMGTLFWQLNDVWPAPTWSSIDYYGNWKALQYQVKADFEDLAVVEKIDELGKEAYYFVSDVDHAAKIAVDYTIFDLSGKVLEEGIDLFEIGKLGNKQLAVSTQSERFKNENFVIEFRWLNSAGKAMSRTFCHLPQKRAKADFDAISIQLVSCNVATKTAVIEVETTEFLADFWLYSERNGIRFDRNFVHLLPGKHTFTVSFEDELKLEEFGMKWR